VVLEAAASLLVAASAPAAAPAASSPLAHRLRPLLRLTSRPCCSRGRRDAKAILGRSAEGWPIRVEAWPGAAGTALGANPRARILVFGCIHGTECAGRAVVPYIEGECPGYTSIWAVPNLNPDGFAAGTRVNGRGVDLNRNFPAGWRPSGQRYDLEYSGPRPFSEPETRLAARLIRLIHPRITVWFHQEAEPMVRAWGQSVPVARRYAKLARLPFRRLPWLAGTAPNWQNHEFPGTASFVVELPPDAVADRDARRYGDAVFQLARFAIHRPR
jgi:protein MpaA